MQVINNASLVGQCKRLGSQIINKKKKKVAQIVTIKKVEVDASKPRGIVPKDDVLGSCTKKVGFCLPKSVTSLITVLRTFSA
jgi:hypothetical protein